MQRPDDNDQLLCECDEPRCTARLPIPPSEYKEHESPLLAPGHALSGQDDRRSGEGRDRRGHDRNRDGRD